MSPISAADKECIKLAIPKKFNRLIDVAIARLYISFPDPSIWNYTGLYGALCLVDDIVGNTFFLKLVDLSPLNKGVIWDQELYVNFDYIQDRTFFHTFELEECLGGILFEDIHEAQHFFKRVAKRHKYGSKNTINNKNAIKLEREIEVEDRAAPVHGPRGEESTNNQRSRYDYSSRIVERVGYIDNESNDLVGASAVNDVAVSSNNSDPYAAYSFDTPTVKKHAPPPPPPPTSSSFSEPPSEYTEQSSFSEDSDEQLVLKSQVPIHRLPPAPEKYLPVPPPSQLPPHSSKTVVQSDHITQINAPPPLPPHMQNAPQHLNASQQSSYGQQQHTYGQEQKASQQPAYGQQYSYGQIPQNSLNSPQQPLIPKRTNAPPPPPPQRRGGPPPPPRKLTGQATGHATLQPLNTQRTGGRGPPPPPPMRRSATGAAPPPPPVRRMAGQKTGGVAVNNAFAVSNVPATTFGATTFATQPNDITNTSQYNNHNSAPQQLPPREYAPQLLPPRDYAPQQLPPRDYVPQQDNVVLDVQSVRTYSEVPRHSLSDGQQKTIIPAPPPLMPQQQNSSIPPPPPPPVMLQQQNSSIPPPPPPVMLQQQNSSIPPPPPMLQQVASTIPPPPSMIQQTSVQPVTAPSGIDSRDALLASIRSSGIGALKKTDKSQINDRSAVKLASEEPESTKPMNPQATGGGGLADALAAALNSRKQKVSSYADEDEGDW
ncbi:hypothetical protein QEN19_000546 [Hanseniaspora menglaensis]